MGSTNATRILLRNTSNVTIKTIAEYLLLLYIVSKRDIAITIVQKNKSIFDLKPFLIMVHPVNA